MRLKEGLVNYTKQVRKPISSRSIEEAYLAGCSNILREIGANYSLL